METKLQISGRESVKNIAVRDNNINVLINIHFYI
jgi:hypothetical protein